MVVPTQRHDRVLPLVRAILGRGLAWLTPDCAFDFTLSPVGKSVNVVSFDTGVFLCSAGRSSARWLSSRIRASA